MRPDVLGVLKDTATSELGNGYPVLTGHKGNRL
jgi:hypothetical protein